jgi:hypothetical protein
LVFFVERALAPYEKNNESKNNHFEIYKSQRNLQKMTYLGFFTPKHVIFVSFTPKDVLKTKILFGGVRKEVVLVQQ